MVLRTNLPEYPDTTVADFDFSVSIGKCESMPDISEALIESKYLATGEVHSIDIGGELEKVKETIACGHSFTFTPKLQKKGNWLASFDKRGRMGGVSELMYIQQG